MSRSTLRVGTLLGIRQIQRANPWVTIMTVVIMLLAFLFLVVISGILVGLIEGGNIANKEQYTGNVIITTKKGEDYIVRTRQIMSTLDELPMVTSATSRIIEGGVIEANYQSRRDFDAEADTVGTQIAGIDIDREEATTGLSKYVVEGTFLNPQEEGYILLGSLLLEEYASGFGDGFDTLEDVHPGDRVRVQIGNANKEFIVKGIIDTKVGEVSIRAFLPERELLRITGEPTLNAHEIAVRGHSSVTDVQLANILKAQGFGAYGKIQTAEEAIPQFLVDIKETFALLGLVFGFVGIVMATITVFIVVFINAVTRQKYIGILKAIGIKKRAIEFAYVFQACVYALIGSGLGFLITYGLLVPAFDRKPLDFPFADGILVAPLDQTIIKMVVLVLVTMLAGFIPAWLIARRNTLDTILGR